MPRLLTRAPMTGRVGSEIGIAPSLMVGSKPGERSAAGRLREWNGRLGYTPFIPTSESQAWSGVCQ